MREGPQEEQPRQPHTSPTQPLSGLSLPSLEEHTARQILQMEDVGAKFAEKLSAPTVIRNPVPQPMETGIITTRWLGGGVFGALFPFQNGEVLSGWISISSAMKANPGLTPSGTFSPDRWDKTIFTCRDHLLPRHETITHRVRGVTRDLVADLLKEFPGRIDLSPECNTEPKDHGRLTEMYMEALRPLTKELGDGIKLGSRLNQEDAKLHQLLGHIVDTQVKQMIMHHALKLFRETRMHTALAQYEQDDHSGIIHNLIEQTVTVSAMVLAPYARTFLLKTPFATIPNRNLKRFVGTGLSIAMASKREFVELWKHLTNEERGTIVTDIAEKAWRKAISNYALSN